MPSLRTFAGSSLRRMFALAALIALASGAAHGYRVTPMRLELRAEPGAEASFVVVNTQSRMIAVQAAAFEQFQDVNGGGSEPRDDDFIISPPQMVLEPGERQTVRVQWIADRTPERELAYRIVFEQVQVPLDQQGAENGVMGRIGMAYTYATAVYVAPDGPPASLEVVSAEPAGDAEAPTLRLVVRNAGAKRGNVIDPVLTLVPQGGGEPVVLEGADIGALNGGLVYAGASVSVEIPWPEGLAYGPVRAELDARMVIV